MLQAPMLDGLSLDPLTLFDDGSSPAEVGVSEVKRCAGVVGIFLNEDSIIRMVGAVLLEQSDAWQLEHRYKQIAGFAELKQPMIEEENQPLQITAMAA